MIQEFVSQYDQKNQMTAEFLKNAIRILLLYFIKKGFFLRKQGIKWPSNDFWRTPNWDLKSTIYLFIQNCTNWPNLYCNLLTLQNTSCSDWSWNLHITMHNRVFRGSKLHLMRMGNIKCKNNVDFFSSLSLHNEVILFWSSILSLCS